MIDVVALLAACLTSALVSCRQFGGVRLETLASGVSCSVTLSCRALPLGVRRLPFVMRALILRVIEVELVFGPP